METYINTTPVKLIQKSHASESVVKSRTIRKSRYTYPIERTLAVAKLPLCNCGTLMKNGKASQPKENQNSKLLRRTDIFKIKQLIYTNNYR